MKVTITSTDKLTHVDGALCRVWKGVTEEGTNCILFVNGIALASGENVQQFERELKETTGPGQVFDLRHVL